VTLSCEMPDLSPVDDTSDGFIAAVEDFCVCSVETDCGSALLNPILIIETSRTLLANSYRPFD
jgi:hypothetical protein